MPVSSVTTTLGTNDPELGAEIRVGPNDYRFMYNASNSDCAPTYGVILSAAASSYSITNTSTTGVHQLQGVVKHSTLSTGQYGWVLTRGWTQVEMEADNSAAVGQILALAADGEFALKSASTQYPANAVGHVTEAIASAGSGQAYITTN